MRVELYDGENSAGQKRTYVVRAKEERTGLPNWLRTEDPKVWRYPGSREEAEDLVLAINMWDDLLELACNVYFNRNSFPEATGTVTKAKNLLMRAGMLRNGEIVRRDGK